MAEVVVHRTDPMPPPVERVDLQMTPDEAATLLHLLGKLTTPVGTPLWELYKRLSEATQDIPGFSYDDRDARFEVVRDERGVIDIKDKDAQ